MAFLPRIRRSFHRHSRYFSSTCRAIVLPRFGGPDVLELRNAEKIPELSSHEVLVATKSVSINPLDVRIREGYGRSLFEPLLPLILGRDVSGVVVSTGNSVKRLQIGEEVYGALHPTAVRGTYSDYAILAEEQLVTKPTFLNHMRRLTNGVWENKELLGALGHKEILKEASAIPFAALTAWRALKGTAAIKEGQRVLVLGGGGSVGLAAIQLARATGCHVTCTCGKRSMDRAVAAGAESTIDYTSENMRDAVGGRYDAVLDTIGMRETEAFGINSLRKGGHYMTLQGEAVNYADKLGLIAGGAVAGAVFLRKQMQYRQSHGIEYSWTIMRTDPEALDDIANLVRDGKMKIPIGRSFSLWNAVEAHDVQEKKQAHGKVVLFLE